MPIFIIYLLVFISIFCFVEAIRNFVRIKRLSKNGTITTGQISKIVFEDDGLNSEGKQSTSRKVYMKYYHKDYGEIEYQISSTGWKDGYEVGRKYAISHSGDLGEDPLILTKYGKYGGPVGLIFTACFLLVFAYLYLKSN